jgi:hypothetical protein
MSTTHNIPTTINGETLVAGIVQPAGQGTVQVLHGIVDAPDMCRGTHNPARRFVFFTDARLDDGARGWGSGSYDLDWEDAVDRFQFFCRRMRDMGITVWQSDDMPAEFNPFGNDAEDAAFARRAAQG